MDTTNGLTLALSAGNTLFQLLQLNELDKLPNSAAVISLIHSTCRGEARGLKVGVHGERVSASLYGGLGAWPPVGCRGKAPGRESGGRSHLKLAIFWNEKYIILKEFVTSSAKFVCLVFIGTSFGKYNWSRHSRGILNAAGWWSGLKTTGDLGHTDQTPPNETTSNTYRHSNSCLLIQISFPKTRKQ